MNAKRAKLLRREAKAATVGQPHELYLKNKQTGAIILHPQSTKGYYRALKKQG